jgi:two-component system cell cycle sensor histidine kinase/response regulator CckA
MAACGAPMPDERPGHSTGPTVVLVEDNDAVRHLSEALLRRLGYEVIAAASGWEALGRLHDHRGTVELLITDIVVPNMSGLEVADRFLDSWPAAKVLYTSGYADTSIMMPGVVAPNAAFLSKPYSFAELSRAVYALAPLGESAPDASSQDSTQAVGETARSR